MKPAPRVRPSGDPSLRNIVSVTARLVLAVEGELSLTLEERRRLLDELFAFLEVANDALPKA